ncbi:MAG: tRNA lysidine(34) synthetase TilS [Cypionkella sp.]
MTDLPTRLLAGLRQTTSLGLAVSGGGDSIALLHLAVAAGLKPAVVTVDHGLRPEAATEAEMVGQVATSLGLSHQVLRWQDWDHTGNLQDAARKARRRLIAEWATGQGISSVALAHTQDDVAETFLMRLARGAGVDGLAAMSPLWVEGGVLWQRPMLGMGRQALRAWLGDRGLHWFDDPSNENLRFDRVKARKALPMLGTIGLTVARLSDAAAHLAEARVALDALADGWADLALTEEAGTLRISADLWRAPLETQRRLIQRLILWIAPAEYGPRGPQVSQLLTRLSQGQAATLAGCRFLPEGTGIRAVREAKAAQARVSSTVWDGRWKIIGDLPEGAEIGALGAAGLVQSPDWRSTGLPRPALLASPALWLGDTLVAAPLAGFRATAYSAVTLRPWIERKNTTLSH